MRPKILVCDNEAPLRELVRATLGEELYEILEARDGNEAVRLAKTERPDLVLLDLMMPGKSGLAVLQELRADATFAETPVIMVTARSGGSERTAAAQAGASSFLAKPFSPIQLLETVEQLVGTG